MKISSTGVHQNECTPKAEINPLNKVRDETLTQHIKVWWCLSLQVYLLTWSGKKPILCFMFFKLILTDEGCGGDIIVLCFFFFSFQEASKTRTRRSTEDTKGNEEGSISRLLDKRTSKTLVTPLYQILLYSFLLYFICIWHMWENPVVTMCSLLCGQSCDNGAKCVKIRCPLQGLDSNAVFTLNSRLWNSTFIEVTEQIAGNSLVFQMLYQYLR